MSKAPLVAHQEFLQITGLHSKKILAARVFTDMNIGNPLTNQDGQYSTYLDSGTYRVTANSDYRNAGGAQNDPTTCVVTSPNAVTNCNIVLKTPNITGAITVGGAPISANNVGFISLDATTNSKFIVQSWAGYAEGNTFGGYVTPGTYQLWVYYETYAGDHTAVPGPVCVVPTSGAVTCDATLPANNLTVSIANYSGSPIKTNVSISLSVKNSANIIWTCCSDMNQDLKDGLISVPLLDGSYQLRVIDNSGVVTNGFPQLYDLVVTNGSVASFKLDATQADVLPANSIYQLKMLPPAFAGTLYETDGTTPAGYASVGLSFSIFPGSTAWMNTDRAGHFAADPNMLAGYLAKAKAMGSSTTSVILVGNPSINGTILRSNSDPLTVTLTDGVGPTNISLTLKASNVRGTVSGPTGLATGVWTHLWMPDSNNNWINTGVTSLTDSNGKYGYNFAARHL
jgi:hypothetical protein